MRAMLLLSTLLSGMSALPSFAAVLRVPGDYLTIQEAVDAAAPNGDTVEVAPGSYSEDVVITGKVLNIIGAGTQETSVRSLNWTDQYREVSGGRLIALHVTGSLDAGIVATDFNVEECIVDGQTNINMNFGTSFVDLEASVFNGSCTVTSHSWEETMGVVAHLCEFCADVTLSVPYAGVDDCILQGTGRLSVLGAQGSAVTGCTLHGSRGINTGSFYSSTINVLENTLSGGDIVVESLDIAGSISIEGNTGCRAISAGSSLEVSIVGNVVIGGGCIQSEATYGGTIQGNVVAYCTSGIVAFFSNGVIENNTVYGCVETGIYVIPQDGPNEVVIQRNVVVGNGRGIEMTEPPAVERVLCNDVYGNVDGNWIGEDFDGINGNFALDPLFCASEEHEFRLAANSPCLPANGSCGLVGALGEGCSEHGACCHGDGTCTVATEVDCGAIGVWLGAGAACDPNPCLAGACCLQAYCARLSPADCASYGGTYEGNGTLCEPNPCPTSGVEEGTGGMDLSIRATPNPSTGAMMIEYALPRAATVTIELFDPAGRLVRRMDEGEQPGGRHVVAWDGRDDRGDDLASGVYLVRLVSSLGVTTGRVAVAR